MRQLLLLAAALLLCAGAFAQHRKVKILTPYGSIVVRLYDETPLHRDNFIRLARRHVLDSTLFHRVIKTFMIQGGDPDSKHAPSGQELGNGDLGYTIPAEFRPQLFHRKGALAAAREDRPDKASSASQFYLVQGKVFTDAGLDSIEIKRLHGRKIHAAQRAVYKTMGGTPQLDQNYTVFGIVEKGLPVIDKIASLPTDKNDRPLTDVPMKVRLKRKWLFF
ncbi:MAG TPA: peptidylprolyl isomerase [Chitinophaga sp.]